LVLDNLPGGGVVEGEVFGLDGKLPDIVQTRDMDGRSVPTVEVSEVMQMGKHGEFSRTYLEEADNHDDAEAPIWLWNTRLKM
jgi:hypothetical protein